MKMQNISKKRMEKICQLLTHIKIISILIFDEVDLKISITKDKEWHFMIKGAIKKT